MGEKKACPTRPRPLVWRFAIKHAFFKFEFDADFEDGTYTDTYLDFKGWGKGCVWVNGFNIGRFWDKGPQKTLYIPGPLLKHGKNEILIFETEGKRAASIQLVDKMKW